MRTKRELLLTVCEHPGMAFDPISASSTEARWVEELTSEGWLTTTGSLGHPGIELHATDRALDEFPKFEGDIAEPEPLRPMTTPREGLDVAEPEQPQPDLVGARVLRVEWTPHSFHLQLDTGAVIDIQAKLECSLRHV